MSDAAVTLLAARVGFAFSPSGQQKRGNPSPTPSVALRMPLSVVPEINWAAHEAGVDRNVYINMVLAEALDADFNPTGRT